MKKITPVSALSTEEFECLKSFLSDSEDMARVVINRAIGKMIEVRICFEKPYRQYFLLRVREK